MTIGEITPCDEKHVRVEVTWMAHPDSTGCSEYSSRNGWRGTTSNPYILRT